MDMGERADSRLPQMFANRRRHARLGRVVIVTDHLESCQQGHPNAHVCAATDKPHRFSGWPGAFCLDCGGEDVNEQCIGGGCKCSCHDAFWAKYEGVGSRG